MKTFCIYDIVRNEKAAEVQAGNARSALRKFQKELISSGFSEIHLTQDDGKQVFELSTTYGQYFRAYAKEGV